MGFWKSAAAAAALVIGLGGTAVACNTAAEKAAVDVRLLQTELMVAALTCGKQSDYNSFVRKFETDLIDHGLELKRYFVRQHGNQRGTDELSRFVTSLANQFSGSNIQHGNQYCGMVAPLFDEVLAMNGGQLAAFSAIRHQGSPIARNACRIETVQNTTR